MRRISLDQQSSDWLEWRKGGIGSSDCSAILGISPWTKRADLLEYKAAHFGCGKMRKTEKGKSEAMIHGIESEPMVRDMFIDLTGIRVEPGCGIHDRYTWMRASFDGINERGSLVIEIKSPKSPRSHESAVAGVVPNIYYPQIQHQLLVSGAECCFYVSWCAASKFSRADQLKIIKVPPSPDYQKYLLEEEVKFWEELQAMVAAVRGARRISLPMADEAVKNDFCK